MTRYFVVFYWNGEPGRNFVKTFDGQHFSIPKIEAALELQLNKPVTITGFNELKEADFMSATTPR